MRPLGFDPAPTSAIDDHVEHVVVSVEPMDVHAALAVPLPEVGQARSLRVIHPGNGIASSGQVIDPVSGHWRARQRIAPDNEKAPADAGVSRSETG